jgi:DNA-binding NarL/FixJ family response regulator
MVLTVHEDRAYLLVEAGVSGYLLKRSALDKLIRAARRRRAVSG